MTAIVGAIDRNRECKICSCMCKYIAPMGIEDIQVSVQGNKIINCRKTGLATLATIFIDFPFFGRPLDISFS